MFSVFSLKIPHVAYYPTEKLEKYSQKMLAILRGVAGPVTLRVVAGPHLFLEKLNLGMF